MTHRLREWIYGCWGRRRGRDGRFGMGHVHTAILKMGNKQGPPAQHRALYPVLCGSLDGSGVWARMEIHVYAWLSPLAVHLKPPQHCWLATLQHKIKSLNWKQKEKRTICSPPTSSPLQRQPLSTFLEHPSSKILVHITTYIYICF